ncbi:hypothetical protein [Campylobacter armoricus]|uniref:Uncharacterized protein n=1 Tax=Campylobacter armoricus TaxID=2505970 RepID=A0A7L5HX12_9BACT|nr:hypothetical protein [Campylobacter armoricus]QKF79536.1 hypothetical protein CARM_0618 [Campylobacter armoricus]
MRAEVINKKAYVRFDDYASEVSEYKKKIALLEEKLKEASDLFKSENSLRIAIEIENIKLLNLLTKEL